MPRLVVEKGVDKGKSIPVNSASAIVVGRDSTAGISINDTMASRNHFRIEARNGGFVLVDLGSKNGTLLNGTRVKESRIKAGDHIQVGETVMSFMEDVKPKEELVGRIVGGGRYKILERIGRGGMGTVYKAEQIRLNRNVALKMLQQELVSDPQFIKKFMDEARAAAQFNHPNVVTIYEIDVANDMNPPVPFIAMEYLPGGSVQDQLSKDKKLPPDKALQIVLDAARGLEYAEKKGIVHRDIKPDNLMISEDGRIKIGDLGLAKSIKQDGSRPEAPEGVFGTPHYIAPEQALNKPIDIRADIYALGATFYRVLAGTTPYQGQTVKEIIVNKLKDPAPPLDVVNPSVPRPIVSVVEKMMKKDPAERYPTAKDLITDLEKTKREVLGTFTGAMPLALDPSSSGTSATASAIPSEMRRPATPVIVLTAAAAMLLVTVGVVIITLLKKEKPVVQPNPPPVVNGDGGPSQEAVEELARKALGNVERKQRDTKWENASEIQELIHDYNAVIQEYAGTGAAKKAEETILFLNGHLQKLAADALWNLAEGQRLKAKAAKDSYYDGKSAFEDVVTESETAMATYDELVRKFPEDERAAEAKKGGEAIDRELGEFRTNHASWEAEKKSIRELIEKKAFGDAEERIATAAQNGAWSGWDRQRKSLGEELKGATESAFNLVASAVQTRVEAHDFEGARKKVEEGRGWKFGPFADRWRKLVGDVDAAETEWQKQESAKKRAGQEAILREHRLRAWDAARERYDFGGAARMMEAAAAKVTDDDLKAEAAAWKADFEAALKLKEEMIRRVKERTIRKGAMTRFEKANQPAEPVGASADSLTVEIQPGATVTIPWREVRNSEYRAVARMWEHEFTSASALIATDMALGLARDLDTDMGGLERAAKTQADKDALAPTRARVAWAKTRLWEQEAEDRHDQARWEVQRGDWKRALEDLEQARGDRLSGTEYSTKHRAEIDRLIETCKEKLKK